MHIIWTPIICEGAKLQRDGILTAGNPPVRCQGSFRSEVRCWVQSHQHIHNISQCKPESMLQDKIILKSISFIFILVSHGGCSSVAETLNLRVQESTCQPLHRGVWSGDAPSCLSLEKISGHVGKFNIQVHHTSRT